jgi:hypothetical protein
MLVLRIVGMITALIVGAGIMAFLFTRDRRYLRLAWRVSKFALIVVATLAALFLLERLAVL